MEKYYVGTTKQQVIQHSDSDIVPQAGMAAEGESSSVYITTQGGMTMDQIHPR